jgi:membrane fusion protein (multidrug efflux system)
VRNPVIAAAALVCACSAEKGSGEANARVERPVPVEVEVLRRGPMQQSLGFVGELAAPEEVELASKVGGRIRSIRVRMGEAATKGALLAQIDDAALRAQYQEAEAALEVAQAGLLRAEVEDKNAEIELARKEPLAKQDLITQQELDNVRTRRDGAAAGLQVATAQISQARARIQVLSQQLGDARITAPFTGWVAARHLDAGAIVSPGTAIVKLVRTDPIVVRFKVSEREVGEIRRRMAAGGLDITIDSDAYRDERFMGRVVRVAPSIDPQSRSAPVEAEVANADGRLMPGMYCRVELDLGSRPDALQVPLRALLAGTSEDSATRLRGEARTTAVFVVADGRARRVSIELGHEHGDHGEVLSGLDDGAVVVVQGQSRLRDGNPVEVVGGGEPPSEPATAETAP